MRLCVWSGNHLALAKAEGWPTHQIQKNELCCYKIRAIGWEVGWRTCVCTCAGQTEVFGDTKVRV